LPGAACDWRFPVRLGEVTHLARISEVKIKPLASQYIAQPATCRARLSCVVIIADNRQQHENRIQGHKAATWRRLVDGVRLCWRHDLIRGLGARVS